MKMKFANNAVTSLTGAINSGAGVFGVQSSYGNLFPSLNADQFFFVRLGTDSLNEVVQVTAREGDMFTCSPTNNGWPVGTEVVLTMSAEILGRFAQADGGGQVLEGHELRAYSESLTSPLSASGVLVLDLATGNVFDVELVETVTMLTINNAPVSGKVGSFTLILSQNATGGFSFTWPAAIKWAGGTAPTLSTDASAIDILTFITTDGGVTWFGMLAGAAFG